MLDVFVFNDVAAQPLKQALEAGQLDWLATAPMRDELERVLGYPQISSRLALCQLEAHEVLAEFDQHARIAEAPAQAGPTCHDPDDQKFIDLAVAHQATLLSKDQAVLCMKKRLAAHDVRAQSAIELVA